jgi:hypothetical protein
VSQQEFDLFQITAILTAQLRTGTAKIMSAEVFDPDLLR